MGGEGSEIRPGGVVVVAADHQLLDVRLEALEVEVAEVFPVGVGQALGEVAELLGVLVDGGGLAEVVEAVAGTVTRAEFSEGIDEGGSKLGPVGEATGRCEGGR